MVRREERLAAEAWRRLQGVEGLVLEARPRIPGREVHPHLGVLVGVRPVLQQEKENNTIIISNLPDSKTIE